MKEINLRGVLIKFENKSKHSLGLGFQRYHLTLNNGECNKITANFRLTTIMSLFSACESESEIFELSNLLVIERFDNVLNKFVAKYQVNYRQLPNHSYQFYDNDYAFILNSYQILDIIDLNPDYTKRYIIDNICHSYQILHDLNKKE